MKQLIFILTLLYSIQISSQTSSMTSGIVTYKFRHNGYMDKMSEKSKNLFKGMYENTEDIELKLIYNQNESLFKVEEAMSNDIGAGNYYIAKTMAASGKHYTNLNEKKVIRKTENGGEEFLVSTKISQNQWSITKESKMIHNYKCFKATRSKTVTNSRGDHEFEIIAWFAPEIPARFGPKEFNSLPGLILELKDTHHTFFVDNIRFLKKPPKINPFKGKTITEEAYLSIVKENLGAFRRSIKKN